MNQFSISKLKGKLNIAKGRLKQRWARLTNDEFQLTEGKQDEQIGRIQIRSALSREAAQKAAKNRIAERR